MAYINSANVKFSNLADLIIEEDGAGNVVNVWNRANGKNYAYPSTNYTLIINNNSSASRICYIVSLAEGGYLKYVSSGSIAAGGSATTTPAVNTIVSCPTAVKFEVVSGDVVSIDEHKIVITSDAEVNLVDM